MTKLFKHAALVALVAGLSQVACADEATVRKGFSAKFPKAQVKSVTKVPEVDLYEVVVGTDVYYVDGTLKYLVEGNLIDLKTEENITAERVRALKETPIAWNDLPLDLAFKKVKGKGERKIAVFSDPDCPYCKRLENNIKDLENVTIYTFLFPLTDIHPQAKEKSKNVWCAADRQKAWDELMLKGVQPARKDCDHPVDKILAFTQKNNINSTPTMVMASGKRVNGAYPKEAIEEMLSEK